jgi:hypothetical protein
VVPLDRGCKSHDHQLSNTSLLLTKSGKLDEKSAAELGIGITAIDCRALNHDSLMFHQPELLLLRYAGHIWRDLI